MADTKPVDWQKFLSESRSLLDHCIDLLSKKNHDYAEVSDPFANFKYSAQVAGTTPAQSVLMLLGMKMSRLTQLVGNGKKPMNEKVLDTMADMINYTLLLRGIIEEEMKNYS